MQTFLINSSNQLFIEKEIEKIIKKHRVNPFNFHTISPATMGIEEVRKIEEIVTLKPFDGGERVILIKEIDKATAEAGNALLKLLEEPPPGNYIVLTTTNMDRLLPTIVSRCQIITEKEIIASKDKKDMQKHISLIKKIIHASVGRRILISGEVAKTREEAIQVLDDLLITFEFLLHLPKNDLGLQTAQIAQMIKKAVAAKDYVERYINFKATLDILFLGFPKVNRS